MLPIRTSILVHIDAPQPVEISASQPDHGDVRKVGKPAEPAPENSSLVQTDPGSQPILDFVASDETLDRFGDVISAVGWRLDTYRRNPVFQNAHQYGDILFTLGRALVTEVRPGPRAPAGLPSAGTNSSSSRSVLFQRIQFATDVNPIARIAYGLYKSKFLNAVSVGFIPLRWQDAPSGEPGGAGSPNVQSLGSTHPHSAKPRRIYLEQELLEVSAVGIPANPNALALGLKSGAIELADLREMLALLREISCPKRRPPNPPAPAGPGFVAPGVDYDSFSVLARELHRILRRA
jgi:hypothetical protein